MLDNFFTWLKKPLTSELSIQNLLLIFALLVVVAILARDTLSILKEGLNNG